MLQRRTATHSCSHCSRRFARTEHRVRHERTHTKEKPFGCSSCKKVFSRRDLLRRHETKAHQDESQQHEQQQRLHGEDTAEASERCRAPNKRTDIASFAESPILSPEPVNREGSSRREESTQASESPDYNRQVSFQWPSENDPYNAWLSADLQSDPTHSTAFALDDLAWLDDLNETMGDTWNTQAELTTCTDQGQHEVCTSSHLVDRDGDHVSYPMSPLSIACEIQDTTPGSQSKHGFSISETVWQKMQYELSASTPYILPLRSAMLQFIDRYFTSFHTHQPFLHKASFNAESTPLPLLLAVCANGALYSFERDVAFRLYTAASKILDLDDTGLWVIQTQTLLIAFAAWSGQVTELRKALQFAGPASLNLRLEWAKAASLSESREYTYQQWLEVESLKRVNYSLFTVMTLIRVAFDFPSCVSIRKHHGLPDQEVLWTIESEDEWYRSRNGSNCQERPSGESIIQQLADTSAPLPEKLGTFACHIIITLLLHRITLWRQVAFHKDKARWQIRQTLMTTLRRWQTMWAMEPDSSLAPPSSHGPIAFNSTAILRLAYMRLVADFTTIRRAFSYSDSVPEIEARIQDLDLRLDDPESTRAALQACLALRIPVQLGFKMVARTSFWIWSVQHALSYFECALFLANWLQAIVRRTNLSQDSQAVLQLVQDVVQRSYGEVAVHIDPMTLSAEILRIWGRLLSTAEMTVWAIIPKMANVLLAHARQHEEANKARI